MTDQQDGLPGMEHRGGQYVTVGTIAKLYNVTERSVQGWAKEIPGIEKNGKGQYNLLSVVRAVYNHQRGLIERGSTFGVFSDIRLQRENEQLRKIKLENDREEGILVDAKEVEKELSKYLVNVRNLRHLPRTYSQWLADACLKFINDILKKKKIKKVTISLKDKKKFRIMIEEALLTDIDKNLELLSRGLDASSLTGN